MPANKASFFKEAWQASLQEALPADAWLVLEGLLVQLGLLSGQTLTIQDRVNQLMAERKDSQRLLAIPGIGEVIAATILAEVADIRRFPNARAFAAFTGLVPRVRSSAGKAKMGHITRCGPPALRWALGHAIFASVRCAKANPATSFYRRKTKKGKSKKVAMCAAGHKLARIIYAMLTKDEAFRPTRRAA